nr:phage terminase large subunit [uncultured Rhodopila sp.]
MLTLQQSDACKLYRPRGAAKALFPCRDPEILLEGPAGTGKTRAVLEKLNRWLLKVPGSRALIVRKTRISMTESVLVTLESNVIPENPTLYPDTRRVHRKNRQSYAYPNGSTLVVGGMDNPDRIMSTEYDMIAAFEATELLESDWEMVGTRLRNGVMPYQQAIADCNPATPSHWLNQRANSGRMTRLLSRHTDNPAFYEENGQQTERGRAYLGRLAASLTGARLLRLLGGKWASVEGQVWEGWDPLVHVVDRFPIPTEWRRIRVIDFGYTNPFTCQWWAFDGDDRAYLYRQTYYTKRLVQDHAEQIKKLTGTERIDATVSDHDAEDRATLAKYGIHTVPATKAVRAGIEAFALRLKKTGDERPRVFVLRDSLVERDPALVEAKMPTCFEEEIDGYVWPKGIDGRPVKEEPVKLNDHGCDAARYMAMYRRIERRPGAVILGGQR